MSEQEETPSFKDGVGSGYHYYRECAARGSTETLTERWITEYGRYLLSIKYYSLVPCEWMNGFMAGWKVGKENAQRPGQPGEGGER